MFKYNYTIRIHDIDAAGLLFYGSLFRITHDAYEAFMDSAGMSIADFIKEEKFMLPIIRTEAEYKKPQSIGDKIQITIQCVKIGKSSFTLFYNVINEEGKTACTVKTVNAVLDAKTRSITQIPKNLKDALKSIR